MRHPARMRPMNVHVRRGSMAEDKYRAMAGVEGLKPEAIAPGIPPTPAHDLIFHGGKTIANLAFTTFYVGGDGWAAADIKNIDSALAAAMSEPTLNNVMAQYFTVPLVSTFKASRTLPGAPPARMSQGDVETLVTDLSTKGSLDGYDYASTVFCLMLPSRTILSDNPAPGGAKAPPARQRSGVPGPEDEADSLNGLGGYHGSIVVGGTTLYYAVGVYSEKLPDGSVNGIPVFDAPWKNVVATFYHELNEARTDPDVQLVIAGGASSLLGWTSRRGEECGDFPVFEANPLSLVFQEIPLSSGAGTVPVQFQYSDFVHGPEGPVSSPRPFASAHKHKAAGQ